MSIEALVSFIVFLFLSLLALAVRWLNERIRRDMALRDLKDLFLPSDDSGEKGVREALGTTPTPSSKSKEPIQKFRPITSPTRRTASRLRLHNKADLRQGIIIMTVLGPCRALEHPDE
ncbi:MAG: hypothetical protein H6750_00850 [Nitrospiraceae bacterium]|nr:hypothetical protein [Nitrospira sp.]MCB9772859.1 hypothetical protein [Nitrospiraceae bacterium]HQU28270.1 hypothetical protein [Nitrospirales bacterium]